MAITLGLVEAVDSNGVYVSMPGSRGVLRGPYETVQNVTAGDKVLMVTTDDGDNVIVGLASAAAPRSTPASSTDNTVPRFDGTGGALQTSGVTIDDSDALVVPGQAHIVKDGISLLLRASDAADSYSGLRFTRGWLRRWDISKSDYPAETGSGNTGSNLEIARYADDQSFLGRITYWRNTGKLTLDGVGSTAGLELGSSGPRIMAGTDSPEGAVTAPVGSLWLRTNGGAGTTLWVKESGSGNTGWVAK